MLESGGKSQPKPVDPGLDISVPAHGQTDLGPNPNTFAIRAGRGNSCRPACTFSRNSRSSVAIRSRSRTSRSFVSIVCRTNCWLQHEATARPLRRRSGNGSPWSRFCNDSDLLAEDLRTVEAEALTLALQAKAGLVLLDESAARARATKLGVPLTGALGIHSAVGAANQPDSLPQDGNPALAKRRPLL